jgi:threonine aldolase
LIEIENTHNMGGGAVYEPRAIEEICDGAHAMGLKVHMDGARVFNAAAACGRTVAELTAKVDSVMFCLSKGLGAPVGSMLVGTKDDMARARLYRKRLGGGMRQAGVLAAAGLLALEESPRRLHEDHANARWMAERLAELPGVSLDPGAVRTNIVIFDVSGTGKTGPQLSAEFRERGVLINAVNAARMRVVTHFDVSRAECERALEAVRETLCAPVAG